MNPCDRYRIETTSRFSVLRNANYSEIMSLTEWMEQRGIEIKSFRIIDGRELQLVLGRPDGPDIEVSFPIETSLEAAIGVIEERLSQASN